MMEVDEEPVELTAKQQLDKIAESTMPWVEKHRPSQLDELVSHEDIRAILHKLIDNNKLPHLLFYGPPGTGKTTTILACARKMYGSAFGSMVLELNASDDRGIQVVREQIKEFAGTKRLFNNGVKLVVLDEADNMTNDAQFALRRVIEKYTRHTRFCMICNYVNKIIPALQSRCTKFRFAPLKPAQMQDRLDHVAKCEKVNLTDDGRDAVLHLGTGDMRLVLNLLQSTHMAYQKVNEENVYLCAGAPLTRDLDSMQDWLFNADYKGAYDNIFEMTMAKGYAVSDIITVLTLRLLKLKMPPAMISHLTDSMATIEYHLSCGGNERLQLGALVGAFITARNMV
ncbi:unnamed protein product [Chrysoparadoxa australica]